jgi:hypothetical protein
MDMTTVRNFVNQRTTGRGLADIVNDAGGFVVKAAGVGVFTVCGGGFVWASFIENVFGPEEVVPISAFTCVSGGILTYGTYRVVNHFLNNGDLGQIVTMGVFGDNPPAGGSNSPNPTTPNIPRPVSQPSRPVAPVMRHESPAPAAHAPLPTGRPVLAGEQSDPAVMTLLADALHNLVIGHTGGGKTTLYHALTAMWVKRAKREPDPAKQGLVVVLDPDAAIGLWPGCKVYGRGSNYDLIDKVAVNIGRLFDRRNKLYAEGAEDFPPLYVVIDEYAAVTANTQYVKPVVEQILRRGRKLNIHLMLGVQDKQMKTMDMKGQTDLMQNFTYIVQALKDHKTGERKLVIADGYGGNKQEFVTPRLPDPKLYKKHCPTPAQAPLWEQLAINEGDNRPPTDDESEGEYMGNYPSTRPDEATQRPMPMVYPNGQNTSRTSVSRPVQNGAQNNQLNWQRPNYEVVQGETPVFTPVQNTTKTPLFEGYNQPVVQGIVPGEDEDLEANSGGIPAYVKAKLTEFLSDISPATIPGITAGEHRAVSFMLLNGYSQNKTILAIWNSKNAVRNNAVSQIKENLEKMF